MEQNRKQINKSVFMLFILINVQDKTVKKDVYSTNDRKIRDLNVNNKM